VRLIVCDRSQKSGLGDDSRRFVFVRVEEVALRDVI